ncbi:MAG: hypothetical protein JXR21_02020 [Candidatus Marinimicrobia bacterium]|nr:hypothetical protein [Candidatus Neomarinimicrobiota bacterium]
MPDKLKRTFLNVALAVLLLGLAGCIEYREELWLNADNSGNLVFEIGLPPHTSIEEDEIGELSIVSFCDSVPGMTVTGSGTFTEGDITWIQVRAEFEDVLLLNQVQNQWFGRIYMENNEENNRVFRRIITMSDTINVNNGTFGKMLKYAALGQYSWIYTLHLPDDIHDSNAPLMRTDTLTNSITWEYNLASLINDQKVLTCTYRHRTGFRDYLNNLFKR